MANNTGNPVPSKAFLDFEDNVENFDKASTSEDLTYKDRLGRTRLTLKGYESAAGSGDVAIQEANRAAQEADRAEAARDDAEEAAATVAGAKQARDEAVDAAQDAAQEADRAEAARDAAIASSQGIYATTADGLAATSSGDYFSVPSSDNDLFLVLYRNVSGSAVVVSEYPSANAVLSIDGVRVNSGKGYPSVPMTRNGVVSPINPAFADFILNVEVFGAREDKFYQVAYYQNGAVLGGVAGYGWILKEIDRDAIEGTSDEFLLENRQDDYRVFPGNGVQTILIHPTQRQGMTFAITVDTDNMLANGLIYNSHQSGSDGWSWVVSPERYSFAVPSTASSLTINQGKGYPSIPRIRDGIVSPIEQDFANYILDVKIYGAQEDKFYQVSYYQNGAEIGGVAGFGWIIKEFNRDDMETTASETRIENRQVDYRVPYNQGIQTIEIRPTQRPSMLFVITVDSDQVKTSGLPYNSNSTGTGGWSWVVSPDLYFYNVSSSAGDAEASGLFWTLNSGTISATWNSGAVMYRLNFGPNGFNGLPNIISFEKSENGGASFSPVMTTSSDSLPPIIMSAVNNGDGGTPIYTGGNHGSDGGAGGETTARNVLYQVLPDNKPAASGSGYADSIAVLIVNEVMAYNTVTLGRYVLRETFHCQIYPGGMTVKAYREALEDIIVENDNGLQAITDGFQGTQLFYGGAPVGRLPFQNDTSSGASSTYPDAWAAVFQESSNGQFTVWMDRSYEAGDGRYVDSSRAFIRMGNNTNTKMYNAVVATSGALYPNLAAGDSYAFRGGYAWQASGLQPAGLDSFFTYELAGEPFSAFALSEPEWWRV